MKQIYEVIPMREELWVTDLAEAFGPKEAIANFSSMRQWRSVPYCCGKDKRGTMLSAIDMARPRDISYDPGLTGWYKIYVALPEGSNVEVHMRLTKDAGWFPLSPMDQSSWVVGTFEESLWRCCDMTGQSVILTKSDMQSAFKCNSMLSWLRFVPMEEAEVTAYLADRARTDTKRIYATDDIHNRLYNNIITDMHDWDSVVLPYEDSDVEWLSLEDVACFTGGAVPCDDPEDFAFPREGDKALQLQIHKFNSEEVLKYLVEQGRKKGLKMSVSLRMGAWTMGFPFDQCYFECPFYWDNLHLRCVGRCGTPVTSLSYAFPEVQDYMIQRLVALAGTGCDALTLIQHRGGPYVMYEKPVADRFYAMYGEYPYELPLDEPRLSALHCTIMTEYFQKLRDALDRAYPDRHVQIHLRSMWSIYDTCYYGIDCEELAKQGLVDAIITYPQRYREFHKDAFFRNGRFDLEAYEKWIYRQNGRPFIRNYDNTYGWDPYPDSNGVLQGPKDLAECVKEWMALEKKYGTKIYIDLMPRVVAPEKLQKMALDVYAAGGERFAMWDTYGRVQYNALWRSLRNFGHKEELASMSTDNSQIYKSHELAGNVLVHNHPCWGG